MILLRSDVDYGSTVVTRGPVAIWAVGKNFGSFEYHCLGRTRDFSVCDDCLMTFFPRQSLIQNRDRCITRESLTGRRVIRAYNRGLQNEKFAANDELTRLVICVRHG